MPEDTLLAGATLALQLAVAVLSAPSSSRRGVGTDNMLKRVQLRRQHQMDRAPVACPNAHLQAV